MDETVVQLPDSESGEHRLALISLIKTTDSAVNNDYIRLINSLSVAKE